MAKWLIAVGIALVLVLVAFGYSSCKAFELQGLYDEKNKQLMAMNLEIGRAKTEFGNANKYIGELEDELQNEIAEREAVVTRYGELRAEYSVLAKSRGNAEVIYVDTPAIEVEEPTFERGLLYEAVTDKTLAKVEQLRRIYTDHRLKIDCAVIPFLNNDRKIPIIIGYKLDFKLKAQIIETRTPTGAINHYVNIFEIDDKDKVIGKLTLKDFSFVVQDETSAHFFWWTPHLDIGIYGGINLDLDPAFGATVGMSFMGYGLTKNDLFFKFLRVGIDFSDEFFALSISPAQWNAATLLPLVSNLWISPFASFSFDGRKTLGLQLTVGL